MSENTYKPILNCEADFLRLWRRPSEKNSGKRCFRGAADDIFSDSFVFRSFRNEFETDNLFTKKSIDRLQKGLIDFDSKKASDVKAQGINDYIPGYNIHSFIPSCSALTRADMLLCFPIYADICSHKNLSPEKLIVYNEHCETIKTEQKLYQAMAKRAWHEINYQRIAEIRPEVSDYTTKFWKKRLDRVGMYPKHYKKCTDLSLIDDSGRKSELIFSKHLQSLGEPLIFFTPVLSKKMVSIFQNFYYAENIDELSDDYDSSKYYKSIHPSLSSHNYHPEISKDKVAEHLATQCNAKIVMSASSFLCLLDTHLDSGARSWELPIVIKEYEEGVTHKRVVYIDKVFPPKSLTAVERVKLFCKKKMCEFLQNSNRDFHKMKQIIDKEMVSYDDLDDGANIDDISKLECFGVESDYVNKTVDAFSKKKIETKGFSGSDGEGPSHIKSDSSIDGDKNDSFLEDLCLSDDSENGLVIDIDEPDKKSNSKIKKVCNKEDLPISTLPPPNKNLRHVPKKAEKVVYNLWSMKCESSNVLLKSNFKDLDMIIRCKEASDSTKKIIRTMSTKLEYQPEFGAEITTVSEITRDWGNALIRPNCDLVRVRLDALSGQLIMYENKNLHDLTMDFQQKYSRNPYDKLSSLHAILTHLSESPPGNYLLSHVPESGSFAQLYREERRHDYNFHLGYLNIDCRTISPAKNGWLQIDETVLTPACNRFNKIPATFHTKVVKCSSKLDPALKCVDDIKRKEEALKNRRKRRNLKKNKRRALKNLAKKNKELGDDGSEDNQEE